MRNLNGNPIVLDFFRGHFLFWLLVKGSEDCGYEASLYREGLTRWREDMILCSSGKNNIDGYLHLWGYGKYASRVPDVVSDDFYEWCIFCLYNKRESTLGMICVPVIVECQCPVTMSESCWYTNEQNELTFAEMCSLQLITILVM